MKFLSLEYIKLHSHIDFDCDDQLLEEYADSAEETIANLLNRGKTVDEMVESLKEEYGDIPANIYVVGQMLVDICYNHPSPISPQNHSDVPYTIDIKLKPYMLL